MVGAWAACCITKTAAVKQHYNDSGLAALTAASSRIPGLNRLQIAWGCRAPPPFTHLPHASHDGPAGTLGPLQGSVAVHEALVPRCHLCRPRVVDKDNNIEVVAAARRQR